MRRLVVLMMLAALPGSAATACASEQYQPRVLFSLRYGMATNEMGGSRWDAEGTVRPRALWGLRAPGDGTLWVGDSGQRRFKRLDEKGQVLLVVDSAYHKAGVRGMPEELEEVGVVHDFEAAPGGRLAVINGQGGIPEVVVFDSAGVQRRGTQDAIAQAVQQALPDAPGLCTYPEGPPLLNVYLMDIDQEGSLYLQVFSPKSMYNVSLTKFDADLKFVGVRPGHMVGWDGRTYGFAPHRGSQPNDQLLIWSPDGEPEATITLRPPRDISEGDYDSALNRWRAVSGMFFDARGGIYVVFDTRRLPEAWEEIVPNVKITDDTVVYKFDRQGNFLTKLVFDGLPFHMYPPIAVDPQGNIYHLRYRSEGVDFVKEELAPEGAGADAPPACSDAKAKEGQ